MNVEKQLSSALATLGYSSDWLEWGLLSEAALQEQITDYRAGPNTHLEHYRYAAFRKILSSRPALTDEEITRYIALAQQDAVQAMAQAALADLLTWARLRPEQFDRLTCHADFAAPLFQKLALRRRLLTDLEANSAISATAFAACLASQDANLQRRLVSRPELTSEQVQGLMEYGVTRAIRNMARNRQGIRSQDRAVEPALRERGC